LLYTGSSSTRAKIVTAFLSFKFFKRIAFEEFLKKKPDYPDRKKLELYIAQIKKR